MESLAATCTAGNLSVCRFSARKTLMGGACAGLAVLGWHHAGQRILSISCCTVVVACCTGVVAAQRGQENSLAEWWPAPAEYLIVCWSAAGRQLRVWHARPEVALRQRGPLRL